MIKVDCDGISIYHRGGPKITEEDLSEIASAVRIASDGDYEKADIAFQKVCNRISVLCFL